MRSKATSKVTLPFTGSSYSRMLCTLESMRPTFCTRMSRTMPRTRDCASSTGGKRASPLRAAVALTVWKKEDRASMSASSLLSSSLNTFQCSFSFSVSWGKSYMGLPKGEATAGDPGSLGSEVVSVERE